MKHFPVPYPDELYYGVIARAYHNLGKPAQSTFEELLFGSHTTSGVYVIKQFPKNLPEGYPLTREEMDTKHTLRPLLEAFRTTPLPPSYKDADRLRSCPQCEQEDQTSVGEPYWHRLHQIPFISVCHKHRCSLQKSEQEVYPKLCGMLKKPNYFTPKETEWIDILHTNRKLQQEVCELAIQTLQTGKVAPKHQQTLWASLQAQGWTRGNYIRGTQLLESLQGKYGVDLQDMFHIPNKPAGKILIRDVVSGLQTDIERCILLYHFLEIHPKEEITGITPKIQERKRWSNPDRKEITKAHHRIQFQKLLEENPQASRGEINSMDNTCSAWLRIHDRNWWKSQLEYRNKKTRQEYDRVNDHDEETAKAIASIARDIKNQDGRPEHITAHRIFRNLSPEIGSRLRSSLPKMPLSQKTLVEVTETLRQAAERRLAWGTKNLPKSMPMEDFLAQAGLRTAIKK